MAVLVVIASHSQYHAVPGDLGVSAFFVLSGFLITWLLQREQAERGSVSLRAFYSRRTLRIFPAYYAFLAASLAADTLLGDRWSAGLTAAAFLYAMNYYNAFLGHPATSIAHCWSLAVEEQFYLVWPWIFRTLAPRGRRVTLQALAVLAAGVMAWRCFLSAALHVHPAYLYNAFDARFDNLAVGCLLAVGLGERRFRAAAAWLGRSQLQPLVTLAALWISRRHVSAGWHYGPGFTVDAVLIAVFLVQMVQLSSSRLWGWLEHPAVRYLGRISYPMYLWHGWGEAVGLHVTLLPAALRFAAGVGATILLASASYAFVEKPFLRLKRRFEVHVTAR